MGNSQVFTTVDELQQYLSKAGNPKVGFVPTMGALHQGHMSLVRKAIDQCDVAVVSIFVNPKQFNNQGDLDNYPRNLEADLELLNKQGDVLVFAPTVDEVYPVDFELVKLDLGKMATVMEGKFRPGHFDGVVNVVKRLFEIIKPQNAYFGQKDFQQVAVIKFMVKAFEMPIEIISCDIVREPSGLASSSRNVRLSEKDKFNSIILFDALTIARQMAEKSTVKDVQAQVEFMFEKSRLELEYFDIVDPETLMPIKKWMKGAHACIAAFCGDVRLIDNMCLVDSE